jgi:hypothetical protein
VANGRFGHVLSMRLLRVPQPRQEASGLYPSMAPIRVIDGIDRDHDVQPAEADMIYSLQASIEWQRLRRCLSSEAGS